MEIGFIAQPYRDTQCASTFIAKALSDVKVTRLVMITAWVRKSGLDLIVPDLRALLDRGGKVDLFVGVDLKGTTIQGLRAARELGATVWIVQDEEAGTFHPKLLLATGAEGGYAFVASNNLTAGGMSFNYEAALALSFRRAEKPPFVKDIERFRRRLVEDKGICLKLTPRLLKRLNEDGWLADEARDRRHDDEDRPKRGGHHAPHVKPIFGKSKFDKRRRPPPRAKRQQGSTRSKRREGKGAGGRQRTLFLVDSWSKKLGLGDAQRSPEGNLTHVVRLTPPRDVKNRSNFFRRVFFKDEHWRVRYDSLGNRLEVAMVKVHARIDNRDLGEFEMEVDYGAYRNVRGRATTVLHWGGLMPELLKRDVTGYYLLIERGQGAYALSITQRQPV